MTASSVLRWHFVAVLLVALPATAQGWINNSGPCGGDACWDPGNEGVIELACSSGGFPGITTTDSITGTGYPQANQSWIDSYWMWSKGPLDDFHLFTSSTCGSGAENGNWWDDGDEVSEAWYESQAVVSDLCDGSAVACEGTDHWDCYWPGVKSEIIATDIAMATSLGGTTPWIIIDQDTRANCLALNVGVGSMEQTWLHEIGHSYGLEHQNTYISVMNVSGGVGARNCHVAQGFSDFPFPDDFGGYMEHHKGYSGSVYQYAATPWTRLSGVVAVDAISCNVTASTSCPISARFTIESMFPHQNSFVIRFYAVPAGTVPAFNWSTNKFDLQGAGAVNIGTALSVSQIGRTAYVMLLSTTLWGSVLPSTGTYWVWGHVDDTYQVAELDEGDNLFPMSGTITRM